MDSRERANQLLDEYKSLLVGGEPDPPGFAYQGEAGLEIAQGRKPKPRLGGIPASDSVWGDPYQRQEAVLFSNSPGVTLSGGHKPLPEGEYRAAGAKDEMMQYLKGGSVYGWQPGLIQNVRRGLMRMGIQ